jgi:hypothetical protein
VAEGFVAAADRPDLEAIQVQGPGHGRAAHAAAPAVKGDSHESGPLGAGEIEPEEDSGFATLLFVGGPDLNAFFITEEGQVDGAGDVAVGEFRRCTDVGDGDGLMQGEKLLYGDRTGHSCKYTPFPTFVIMRRFLVLLVFCGLIAPAARLEAQTRSGTQTGSSGHSVLRTKWKTYYLPITDTVTVTFGADSMAVTTSTGAALLRSTFTLANDALTLHDYGGENMCADLAGAYHVRIMDDTLILIMDRDPCDTRSGTLMAKRWIRVAAPAMAAPAGVPAKGKGRKRGT